jgi:hypothetical protein
MTVEVQKTVSDRYTLKKVSGGSRWWADITISSDGFLNVQSDYGSYHYRWGSFGESFTEFLIGADASYICSKFSYDTPDVFDDHETMKRLKTDILEHRKSGVLSEKDARESYRLVEDIGGCSRETEYVAFISAHPSLVKVLYDDDYSLVPLAKSTDHQLRAFMREVWPEFILVLRNDRAIVGI